jgi:predicted ABC-type ATPase
MPVAILLAGPNGAGKSSVLQELDIPLNVQRVLTDEIAEQHRADGVPRPQANARAAIDVVHWLSDLEETRQSFIYETNLHDPGLYTRCRRLRGLGYKTRVIFVGLRDPEIAVRRVATRVAEGGHPVPEKDIRRRWKRGLVQFFDRHRPIADWWQLFDNGDQFTAAASGKRDEQRRIFHDGLWEEYVALARRLRSDDQPSAPR